MRKLFSRSLALALVITLLVGMMGSALAATYRPGAQSGPSTSYKNGVYYSNYTKVPITGDGRTDVVAIALSQLGYQEGASNGNFSGEVSGRNNYVEFSYNLGEFGLGYGGSDFPWCASFVSWCLYQSHNTDQNTWRDLGRYHVGDYQYIWKEISCSQWVRQLKGAGYYKYSKYEGGSYTPKYGDLVFFQNSNGVAHIGICLYVSGGRIYTVEGNTSDSSGLEANGGGVYFKNYAIGTSYINGYGVLPYKTNSNVAKIDYSGNNPTPGLYVANAAKYIYSTETGTSYSWIMDRFTMFEVTQVCSNGRLKVVARERGGSTVTGYITNNSDRVIQLSSTATDAVDTARATLQSVIKSAQNIRHYDYTEATIGQIRDAYNAAVTAVNNASATEAELTAAAAKLRNLMGQTGSNTIALENQGIYINGRNKVITAGDCFIYSPTWNNGLITVDNANIRYTINVVCTWDIDRQINVVKSVSVGTGNATPSIQLGETDFLIACHDWETGIASGDNPVKYSGTNYKILSQLEPGDAVRLSGATALNAGTDVEPAAYLKFIPKEAVQISGENERVANGKAVVFTPDFNQGLLTHENANVHNTLNVLLQWDDAKSAWIVADQFAGNGAADESSNVEIVDGQVLIACHVGDTTAMNYNWNMLNAAKIGQKVIFSGVSPTDGAVKLSLSANVSFVDYVAGDDADQTGPVNIAIGKDYDVLAPGTSAHTAVLTDGQYTDTLSFTGEWFGFAAAGANKNTDDSGSGTVVLDLGSTYALDSFRLHLYAGANEASVGHPSYVDVYVSNNGTDYVFLGSPELSNSATAAYWASLSEPGYAGRYVKFVIGSAADGSNWVFLNELEVYGTELTGGENVALTTGQQGTPVEGYSGNLTNGLLSDWYGIDTTSGKGSVIIDLGSRFKVNKVLAFVNHENAPTKVSVSISSDGTNYIKSGELTLNADATEGYWAELTQDDVVGRYVKLEAESGNAMVLLSEVAVAGTVYVRSADSNVAMGKDTIFTYYAGSPFTALLNDGLASSVFQYNVNNSSWFAFQNSGDSTIDNVTVNNASTGEARGIITIDLGGQAEITDVSVHLYGGANDAGAVQPRYINVYYSVDGAAFGYMGYIPLNADATGAYWATLNVGDSPITAGYVKLALGTMPGDLVLLNEVKVGGLQVSVNEPNEPGSLSNVVLSGEFNNWNPTPNMMILDDERVTTNMALAAGTYEFKIFYNNEWFGNDGKMTDGTGESAWVMDSAANNCTITTTRDGQYAFTFNRETKELTVAYVPDALYLRGSFNDWGTDDQMIADANGIYTITKTLEAGVYEYKVSNADYFVQWPANNATLELDVKSEVTITFDFHTSGIVVDIVELEEPVVQPGFEFTGASLVFENEIFYNFYFMPSNTADVVEYGIITFTTKLADGTHADAVDVIPGAVDNGDGTYTVRTNGIPAKEMGDWLYFRVYAKLSDDSYAYATTYGYRATAYANTVLSGNSDTKTKALMVAMLNYGAAAQEYFGHNTDSLMNAGLTEAQKALVDGYSADMLGAIVSADSSKTAAFPKDSTCYTPRIAVGFEGAFAVNYYFTPKHTPDGQLTMYYWDAATYNSISEMTRENATSVMTLEKQSDGSYLGAVEGIAAKEVDSTIYVALVYTSGGTEYCSGILAYSLGTYFKSVAGGTSTAQPLGAAVAAYSYYAKQYFAN